MMMDGACVRPVILLHHLGLCWQLCLEAPALCACARAERGTHVSPRPALDRDLAIVRPSTPVPERHPKPPRRSRQRCERHRRRCPLSERRRLPGGDYDDDGPARSAMMTARRSRENRNTPPFALIIAAAITTPGNTSLGPSRPACVAFLAFRAARSASVDRLRTLRSFGGRSGTV